MPQNKRASMREGPLAALFRKTTEDTAPGGGAEQSLASGDDERDAQPSLPGAPEAAQESQTAPTRSESQTPHEPEVDAPDLPGTDLFEAGDDAADPPEQAPAVPSPQERLRQVFSSDIPENLMERPTPTPEPAPEPALYHRPEPDVYARSERASESYAPPFAVGTPVLRVVGVGGAGVNAVNRMIEAEIAGVEFIAINTDLQSLQQSSAPETLHIGDAITRGLGSGSNPELGRAAAKEEHDRIKAMLRGSDMVFIAAGAGGGTGTGAAPVVAQIARDLGALTVGIVTRPFQFEGTRRRDQAEVGIAALAEEVDTLIVVPNNRLLTVLDRHTSMVEAFRVADDVLRQGVQGISDLVTLPGLINLDFADVRTIMSNAGNALLGIGMGSGEKRAVEAAEQAVASPLLETSMEGAHSILLSITGGRDISLWEVNEAAKTVAAAAHPDANIIFGAMVDEKLEDQVWVTVVATGYGDRPVVRRPGEPVSHAGRPLEGRLREDRAPRAPEPEGAPSVRRLRRESPVDLDVPEFIPRR
jgi:cell division protein FtsZ